MNHVHVRTCMYVREDRGERAVSTGRCAVSVCWTVDQVAVSVFMFMYIHVCMCMCKIMRALARA